MKLSNTVPHARIGERSLEIRGEQQKVPTYDFAKLRLNYAEHVNGTGHPGSYRLDGSLTDTQKVSLTVEPNGSVRLLSRHFEPDPELGNTIGSEPSRVDPVRDLFPEEVAGLVKGLRSLNSADPSVQIIFDRLGGKSAPEPTSNTAAQQLAPRAQVKAQATSDAQTARQHTLGGVLGNE